MYFGPLIEIVYLRVYRCMYAYTSMMIECCILCCILEEYCSGVLRGSTADQCGRRPEDWGTTVCVCCALASEGGAMGTGNYYEVVIATAYAKEKGFD